MLTDEQIIESLRRSSFEFRGLEKAHQQLDDELNELQRRHALTPQEELLKKRLQKEKLTKKDRMAELIRLGREEKAKPLAR